MYNLTGPLTGWRLWWSYQVCIHWMRFFYLSNAFYCSVHCKKNAIWHKLESLSSEDYFVVLSLLESRKKRQHCVKRDPEHGLFYLLIKGAAKLSCLFPGDFFRISVVKFNTLLAIPESHTQEEDQFPRSNWSWTAADGMPGRHTHTEMDAKNEVI